MPTYYDATGIDTSNGTASSAAWITWTTSNVTTADGTANTIWLTWTSGNCSSASTVITTVPYVDARTPEQVAADNVRFAAERERVAERARVAEAARIEVRNKARALLRMMLNEQQRAQLEREMFFEIVSSANRRFRIRQGTHGNVRLLDKDGKETIRYCGQPNGVPDEDAMLAQKLMIETDEAAYLRAANATRLA